MLSFGAESAVFEFDIRKYIDCDKMFRTIISPVLYGCVTWSLKLKEERRLRVFESGVLRRIFGPKRDEIMGNGRNYIMRSLIICIRPLILFG